MNQTKNIVVQIFKTGPQPQIIVDQPKNNIWTHITLAQKQFVAQIDFAPLNPLDISKIRGDIAGLNNPFTPGSECNGTIIRAFNEKLIGKKVCFFALDGSWKNFALGTEDKMIELTSINENNCNLFINPFTALGLLDRIIRFDSFISSAANSALGQILIKLAKREKKKVINIVRSQKRVQELEDLQAENILYLEDSDFDTKLKALVDQLNCKVYLDCYGGETAGRILKQLPAQGLMINYGSLISKNTVFDAPDLRFKGKQIDGFNVMNYLAQYPNLNQDFLHDVQKHTHLFTQSVAKVIELKDANDVELGIKEWNSQIGGKIIFKLQN